MRITTFLPESRKLERAAIVTFSKLSVGVYSMSADLPNAVKSSREDDKLRSG